MWVFALFSIGCEVVLREESYRLRLVIIVNALGSALILTLIVGIFWLSYQSVTSNAFLSQGQLFLLVPLFAFWVWLLRSCPGSLAKQIEDLRSGDTHSFEGICHIQTHRGVGLIAPLKHYVVVNGFRMPAYHFPNADNLAGQSVKVRRAALSGTLLSIAPHRDENSDTNIDITSNDRERLKLMCEGLSDKVIARKLGLSPSTVRTYNSALFKRIGASSRQEAVEIARNKGLIDVD